MAWPVSIIFFLGSRWFFISSVSRCSLLSCSLPSLDTARIPRSERNGGVSVGKNELLGSRPSRFFFRLSQCCQYLLNSRLQCLANSPHDPSLSATVNPALSLIPPINQSSSRFDGLCVPRRRLSEFIC